VVENSARDAESGFDSMESCLTQATDTRPIYDLMRVQIRSAGAYSIFLDNVAQKRRNSHFKFKKNGFPFFPLLLEFNAASQPSTHKYIPHLRSNS